ncbi:hypothetical protein ACJMK2_023601 [Sinanodonta woodiana]|uniref:WD repeat-containing protein 75 second beta-propeller domain-containing protein n=1 Tax=Sinanodonta woodiana TaxID=1069815 RepID=A0ABD3T6C4_SINWO
MATSISNTLDEEQVKVTLKSGASLVKTKPSFSFDSKCLFCGFGSVVKVFSTSSGECIRELRGHEGQVTGLIINPKNRLQLLSCSLDKTVVQWDYSDGVLLKRFWASAPLLAIYPLDNAENDVLCLQQSSKKGLSELVVFSMNPTPGNKLAAKTLLPHCTQDSRQCAVGARGEYVVSVNIRELAIKSIVKDKFTKHLLERDKAFTCVACHPDDYCIATGTKEGKIVFWWNFLNPKKVVNTVNHWHALPVLDLCFTIEGSYLLSGGHECVLVKWQYNSTQKDFKPRLGAPINHVNCSRDNTMYAVCHDDNVIHLISSNFDILQVYQGLTKGQLITQINDPIPMGMICDPRTKSLVMNGKPGHIQFYSVHQDKQLFNLDIVCQNYISPENIQKPTTVTEVVCADFDSSGCWLATVEYWDDGVMTPEIRLKFWEFSEQSQSYVLNTTVEMAHEKRILSLRSRPTLLPSRKDPQPMMVTSSSDGKFKLWSLVDDTDIHRSNQKWSCESVGFYRDLPAGETAFSEDGSLLAVAFSSTITLWDPTNNLLKRTLLDNLKEKPIRHLKFGNHSCAHLLVSANQKDITVWNLLSCTVLWSVGLKCNVLVDDPFSDVMAVITNQSDLHVFRPSETSPIYSHNAICSSDIISAVFIPHTQKSQYESSKTLSWQSRSQLYFFTRNQDLLTLTLQGDEADEKKNIVSIEQNLPQTALSLLMASKKKSIEQPGAQSELTSKRNTSFLKELLLTAPHVQPPVTSLCKPFIQALLTRKKSSATDLDKEEDEDNSDSEEIEDKSESSDLDSDMEVDLQNQSTLQTSENQSTNIVVQRIKPEEEETVNNLLKMNVDWFSDCLKP